MRKAIVHLGASFGVIALWVMGALAGELTTQQIYERTAPAVVFVTGLGTSGEKGSGGTGSIVSRDGLVLTNAHVVVDERSGRPYSRLFVYLKPERVTGNPKTDLARGVRASLVGYSQPLDLALLRMETSTLPFQFVDLADSDKVHIGDRVVAIGHPEQGGLWTLTTGVISTEFADFHNTKGKDVFQTETGLNRGNSGGPLLDTDGRMVGINTAIARVAADGMPITSISFSLKSNVARTWLREQGVVLASSTGTSVTPKPAVPATDRPGTSRSQDVTPSLNGPSTSAPSSSTVESPKEKPTPPVKSAPSKPPTVAQTSPSPRPYNLDQVVDELTRAEAEMEDMIKDSRKEIEMRSRRMGGR